MKISIILFVIFITFVIYILKINIFYPRPFEKFGHFTNMISVPDEVDPWTTWDEKNLDMAAKGLEYTKTINLVVSALLKDVEHEINFVYKKINTLASLFNHIQVIFMENNSKDNTRKILLSWCLNSPWKNVSVICVDPTTFEINSETSTLKKFNNYLRTGCYAGRIERMAFLRNRLHEFTCDWLEKNKDFTFVLYCDLDLHGSMYKRGICHTFGEFLTHNHIQVIGFRGVTENGWMWDPFAYEDLNTGSNLEQLIFCKMGTIKFGFSHGLVRVSSSFSGGTFIRARDLKKDFKYKVDYFLGNLLATCEHVPFYRNFNFFYVNTFMTLTHSACNK